ncbi:MAG: hypothetical protein Fur007_05080 [Rhodoferax sp.]
MRFLSLALLLILTLIGTFLMLNWEAVLASTTLSFGLASLQAPLGLIMLGLMLFLVAFFALYVLVMQSSVLLDARKAAKELHTHRELADKAEASRFTELRTYLESHLNTAAKAQELATLQHRVDTLEHNLKLALEQHGNALAAQIAEFEDRWQRRGN